MAIEYRGEKFSGYNKPKATPSHGSKSHAVLAKSGSTIKLIRFGQKGVKVVRRVQKEIKLLEQGMLRTSRRVKCRLHIGQQKLNGN
jgi:hypothetical protein